MPRSTISNEIQGCPQHGTEIFKFGAFYPWRYDHFNHPGKSICPIGGEIYPSNDYDNDDFLSGAYPDDGFGYIDADGNRYQFVGAQNWSRVKNYLGGIMLLGRAYRGGTLPDGVTPAALLDRIGVMITRFVAEELYLAAVPQFRFGNHHYSMKIRGWGPPETAGLSYPHHYTVASGTQDYCVNQAGVVTQLATLYDAIYDDLKINERLPQILRPLGVEVGAPSEILQMVEEMIACFVQHDMDGYNNTNHPGTSLGTLVALRVLDPIKLADAVAYLYDDSDDQLRTQVPNGFYPDGVGYEATGGYSAGHVINTYKIVNQLEALRRRRPEALPTDRFPPLHHDPRFRLMADPFRTTIYCGRTALIYGDDRVPGAMSEGLDTSTALLKGMRHCSTGWVKQPLFAQEAFRHNPDSPLWAATLAEMGLADKEPGVPEVLAENPQAGEWPSLLLEHGGIGVLRLRRPDGRDYVAVGHHFISQPFHRHDDFMDVQLVAFNRVWSLDFGYPATHETCHYWEGSWAVHNRSKICDGNDNDVVGSGRCTLFIDRPDCAVLATEGVEGETIDWRYWRPHEKYHRRLLVLIPTVGEGFALVDIAQLQGGTEHWRTFMGWQGDAVVEGVPLTPRAGTAAGCDISRGERKTLPVARQALAMIDQIKEGNPGSDWSATYTMADDTEAKLDLHVVGSQEGVKLQQGRGTHPLIKPEESPYRFSPLLLSRTVTPETTTTFNMVFEARLGAATVVAVEAIAPCGDNRAATGIRLKVVDGTTVTVLWNPLADEREETVFDGGLLLRGRFALTRDSGAQNVMTTTPPGGALTAGGRELINRVAAASGKVVAIDDATNTITLQVCSGEGLAVGAWLRIGPRRHWYKIKKVTPCDVTNQYAVTLAASRVLSIGRIKAVDEREIALDARLPLAWGDYFYDSILESDDNTGGLAIENVKMREDNPIAYAVLKSGLTAELAPQIDSWVKLVDFQIGATASIVAD